MFELFAILALAGSAWMAAVAWMVQRLNYPALAALPAESFPAAHRRHVHGIGPIVCLGLLLEGAGAAGSLALAPERALPWVWAGAICCAIALALTFAISAPIHGRLSQGHDPALLSSLIRTTSARTLVWMAHAVCAAMALL